MKIQTKDVLGLAAVAVVGFLIFKLYKDNQAKAGFAGDLRGKRWRVGGYNPNTRQTLLINADNPSETKYVSGRVNLTRESIFSGG